MTTTRPLWQGRALAVLGILLCAFSLRSAVASLSPVIDHISVDFVLSPAVIGLIGTAPPVCFAVFGLLTPFLERRFGLERLAVVALAAVAVGLVLRGLSIDSVTLLLTTALIFAGVGTGNILLPPLVKKYFPDRLGTMMTLYTTAMACSTFLPPLLAVPVADAAGWRFSLALWGVFAAAGVVPWLILLVQERTGKSVPVVVEPPALVRPPAADFEEAASVSTGPIVVAPADSRSFSRVIRIPLSWALAVVFGTSSTMAYVTFAWLPSILVDHVGVSPSSAGLLLSLFAFVGLPSSLLVPILVVRFQATRPLYFIGALGGLVGLLGLLLVPDPAIVWLWVCLYGLVGALFPLSLVLISIRARTPESAVALSGFVQSVGYTLAAVFPILIGVLHETTGGWQVPLIVVAAVIVASIPAGLLAGRRRTVEDEWEQRHGRW
ncbi:CP family cyanate transporter-like MFS transporter [Microbacterium resistens]|uniref:CP family cyanate transporter-like MFS transporter n=1 Tax=Microbacterium resistens TaxID=156977 RepID=A0ABU1SC52_9MICO|nr:MFS transporter [Microbacterium resistens]MDR6866498.1 CP family cyanate transporter-like MFS transporter [Microbacterium resistens]